MNKAHGSRIENSADLQCELERALKDHGGNDIVVSYNEVAFAFPSSAPNPYFFDCPLINHKHLKQWAQTRGWQVQLAPELVPEGEKQQPSVRFTRIT